MRNFSGFLILMGAGSMVLHLIGFNFILMSWVDAWGETVGWIIRGAVLGLGLTMAVLGNKPARPPASPPSVP